MMASKPAKKLQTLKKNARLMKSKPTVRESKTLNVVDRLSDEVLLILFSYLDASDLLVAARVCRRWLQISNDNVLWRSVSLRYLPKSVKKRIGEPLDAPTQYWKNQCIQQSVEWRNRRAFANLKAADPFTLLPANTKHNLQELGVKYALAFRDRSGSYHYISADDQFYQRMSISCRWYNFGELPPPPRLQSLKLLALNPVFYDQKEVACKNSPCQRSLLQQLAFDWSKVTSAKPVASDSAVDIFSLDQGISVAAWKDGGGIAFIIVTLHYHNLIGRCLKGSSEVMAPPHDVGVRSDPIDRQYGLHGYTATVELRNQRQSIWSEQFRDLYQDRNAALSDTGCVLQAIRSGRTSEHSPLERSINLPWKTELFKNKTPNVCILDVCLRDEHGRLVWFISELVQCRPNDSAKVSYDYEGQGSIISFSDNKAKLEMVIDKDSSGRELISSLTISILFAFINNIFSTSY